MAMKKRLNVGCGKDYKKDWINLDYNKEYNPEGVHNLDKFLILLKILNLIIFIVRIY